MLGRLFAVSLLLLFTAGMGPVDSDETVRVRLFAGQIISSVEVSDAKGDQLTILDSSDALATLDAGESVRLEVWNEFLRARWQSGSVPMDRAVFKSGSGAITVTVDDVSRSYRGSIELSLDGDIERPGLIVINEVALPDYVSSVLPSEYGFTEPEGMKAQAIVIRTYALRARSQRQGLYDLTDDTGSQVYLGIAAETDLGRAAVNATSGMTITHDGNLIEAVYSAHCGGHSADNEDVWSSRPVSYLRGREDPYDKDAPVAEWESRIKRKELLDMLSRMHENTVKDVHVADRGSGDRATLIRLDAKGKDINMTAQSFRVAVNNRFGASAIKSTLFDVEKAGDNYRFSGRGLGHGVGLCQWGAAAQAKKGRNYRDILSFYYKDVEIEGYESDFQVAATQPEDAYTPLADAGVVDQPVTSSESVRRERAEEPVSRPKPGRSGNYGWVGSGDRTSSKPAGRRTGW